MAASVLELRRTDSYLVRDRAEVVGLRSRHDIFPAALSLARLARDIGLRIIAWHNLATQERMMDAGGEPLDSAVFGWEEPELAIWYDFDNALRSPLLRTARIASEAVWINQYGIHATREDIALKQVPLDNFAHLSPAPAAIIVPVHMPFGQIGAAILHSGDSKRDSLAYEFTRANETLVLHIARFIAGYSAISRDERYLPGDCLLSSREIECLSWVAHGKTDFEIGIILGCSHAGVRYHLTRAATKLGAMNRAHSVFRAYQLGYISCSMN